MQSVGETVDSGAHKGWYFLYNALNWLKISNRYHANVYIFVIGYINLHTNHDSKTYMHCSMMKSGAQVGH